MADLETPEGILSRESLPSFIALVQCGINRDEIKGANLQSNQVEGAKFANDGKVCLV